VTAYLLDENVLRELRTRGNANVRKWIATVDDTDLRLSVATLFEKRRGAQMLKRKDPARAAELSIGAGFSPLIGVQFCPLSALAQCASKTGAAERSAAAEGFDVGSVFTADERVRRWPVHNGTVPRWRKHIEWAKQRAVVLGLVCRPNESGWGVWALTPREEEMRGKGAS
jgi:hypothetical protein